MAKGNGLSSTNQITSLAHGHVVVILISVTEIWILSCGTAFKWLSHDLLDVIIGLSHGLVPSATNLSYEVRLAQKNDVIWLN